MKEHIFLYVCIALLCGCNKPVADSATTPSSPRVFEYSTQLYKLPSSIAAIAESRIAVENSQRDLLIATASRKLRSEEISEAQANADKAAAIAKCNVNTELIQWRAENEKSNALNAGISALATNGWELVSVLPASKSDNYFFILKHIRANTEK